MDHIIHIVGNALFWGLGYFTLLMVIWMLVSGVFRILWAATYTAPAKSTKLVDTKPKFRNMRGKYTPKPVSPEERARRKRNAEAFRNYVRGIGTK